jgi:Family of unknown function (DUF6177)
VVEQVTWHPAADRATIEALIAEQDRSVVPLTGWLADAAAEAVATQRTLQVLTPAYSRITFPLELMLRDSGGQWILREGPERFRDALSGVQVRWNGARFATDPNAVLPELDVPAPGSGDLELQVTTMHPPSSSLQLGASAETAVRAITGSDPAGWGVSEPSHSRGRHGRSPRCAGTARRPPRRSWCSATACWGSSWWNAPRTRSGSGYTCPGHRRAWWTSASRRSPRVRPIVRPRFRPGSACSPTTWGCVRAPSRRRHRGPRPDDQEPLP